MTILEFEKEYTLRLSELVDRKISEMTSDKSIHYNKLFQKHIENGSEINYKANTFIFDIFKDNNLDFSHPLIPGYPNQPINSFLYQKLIPTQKSEIERYEELTKPHLLEALNRDFPDHQG